MTMPKLPRKGVGYQCLSETEGSLSAIMAGLGLKPLSRKGERKIRERLGLALAHWEDPNAAVQIKVVARQLNGHAKRLDDVASIAKITRGGIVTSQALAVGTQLVERLAKEPAIGSAEAHAYLDEFCVRAGVIATACRAAATALSLTKGRSGRAKYYWYEEFTSVLVEICDKNRIKPDLGTDRISGEPTGRLAMIERAPNLAQ
jgi:hypothetical protein